MGHIKVTIKDEPPGQGWPQYGRPVKTAYGHHVEVFMSSIAFDPHCWLRIFDPDGSMKIDPITQSPDAGCDLMAHLTLKQAIAVRDRLTAFIEDHQVPPTRSTTDP
jgi:hypothetical protein